jgi:hypothetical protein
MTVIEIVVTIAYSSDERCHSDKGGPEVRYKILLHRG